MMTIYEKQPIENAIVYLTGDNIQTLIVAPKEGYKLRQKGDETYSSMQISLSVDNADLLDNYHTVSIDTADEVVENPPIEPTITDEISDSEALAIITSGGVEDDES